MGDKQLQSSNHF